MTEHSNPGAVLEDPWGARARDWAQIEDENSRGLFETLLDAVGVGPESALLDVGCGSGLACAMAAQRGAAVAGLDASPGLVALARERVADGDFRVGDMEALPFEDDRFDAVTFVNTLFFAGDRDAALREAARVTRPGGKVAAAMWTDPDRVELTAYVAALQPLLPPGSPALDPFVEGPELEALARRAGLAPERTFEADWSWTYPDLATALRGLMSPGLSVVAAAHAGEDAVRDAITAALEPYRATDGSYRIESVVRCLVARA